MKSDLRRTLAIRGGLGALASLLTPSLAHAHVGIGQTSGFLHGLQHPVTGLDHIAAMVAVGLWAAQRGGRALWVVPITFVTVMSLGGLLGTVGVSMPFVEPAMAASVLVIGVLIATAARLPLVASTLLVGLFAVFHGHAHGAEMPETASGLAYGVGFVLATGLLHSIGTGVGLFAKGMGSPRLIRYAGGATVAIGLYLSIA